MAELLLELLSEEIPARMQDRAADDLKRLVCGALRSKSLSFDSIGSYVTSRRLVVVVNGLDDVQADWRDERRGPRVDAPKKAIEGFLKSVGLEREQLEERETDKGRFLFAVVERKGRSTAELLAEVLPRAVASLPWPKAMRWGAREDRWVRPLHGILCLFDGAVVPFAFGNLAAGHTTAGHRFLAPEPFAVTDFDDYRQKLCAAYVMLDAAERREVIEQDAALKAKAEGLTVVPDAALIAENAGLVEWPVVLSGAIDPAFMDLPPEVLTTAMRSHQKYFTLTDADGALAPRFLVVANAIAGDGGKQIVAGNERVLRARLADAKFFWDQDRKRTLESRVADLDGVTFHAKLGSLGDKARRIEALAVEIAQHVPGAEEADVRVAARLAKADLTTGMVGEFPELQGVMGRYYALAEGKNETVATAIAEHYAPLGPNDACPTAPVSVAVALADKIDTLVRLFAIGEKPTGSKDPFALRRAALGVIRLIVDNKLQVSLFEVFDSANSLLPPEIRLGLEASDHDLGVVSHELLAFFGDRLKVHLKEKGVRHDLINAVFAIRRHGGGIEDNLVRLLARVEALQKFLVGEDGEHLLTGYRRAANIVRIEEKKDGKEYRQIKNFLFEQDEEETLWQNLHVVQSCIKDNLADNLFTEVMKDLAQLRDPIDNFFDEVTVNVKNDKKRRANRLALLRSIMVVMNQVAEFSKIEGGKR